MPPVPADPTNDSGPVDPARVDQAVDPARVDGRLLRSRRTRAAVVDALLALNRAGDLRPTAPRIATQAGVSLRTVWQHFEDMEALYAEAGVRFAAEVAAMTAPVDTGQPLTGRIAAFVEQRCRVLEDISPVAAAARLREPFSPALRVNRATFTARSQAECERVFAPELAALPPAERTEVLVGLVSVSGSSYWHSLREDHHLDPAAAATVVARSITGLLLTR